MNTSSFSFAGVLELSTRQSPHFRIFHALKEAQGKSFVDGGVQESELYAEAVLAGSVVACAASIDAQQDPLQATWGLPALEKAYEVHSEFGASLPARQDSVALWMKLPRNSTTRDIATWLEEYLGDDFVGLWLPDPDDVVNFPANFMDSPMMFRPPTHERKNIRLIDAVVTTGSSVTVRYAPLIEEDAEYALDPNADDPETEVPVVALLAGEELVIDCADFSRCERITIEEVGFFASAGEQWRTFTATFTGVHDWEAPGTTYHFPFWETTAQAVAVVVKPSVMSNPRKTKDINRFLRTAFRHDTTWTIAEETNPGQAGPFKVAEGKIGITPIGTIVVL
jgi:hypothetical protein